MIDDRNLYDQPVNSQINKYDEIRKISTGQRDDYTIGCLLDYQYFKDHYRSPLMKVTVPLPKNVLAPLGITAAALPIDVQQVFKERYMVLEQQH